MYSPYMLLQKVMHHCRVRTCGVLELLRLVLIQNRVDQRNSAQLTINGHTEIRPSKTVLRCQDVDENDLFTHTDHFVSKHRRDQEFIPGQVDGVTLPHVWQIEVLLDSLLALSVLKLELDQIDVVFSDVMHHFVGLIEEELHYLFRRQFLVPDVAQMCLCLTLTAVLNKVVDVLHGTIEPMVAQSLNELSIKFRTLVLYEST